MRHLIESVRASLREENWHAALAVALMIPNVCANLEAATESKAADYIRWCDTYVLPIYRSNHNIDLNGNEIYVLRCAYIHQASSNISEHKKADILEEYRFIAPMKGWTFGVWQVSGTRKLQLSVGTFCSVICDAAQDWIQAVLETQEEVRYRSEQLLRVHDARTDGLELGKAGTSSIANSASGGQQPAGSGQGRIIRQGSRKPISLTKKN